MGVDNKESRSVAAAELRRHAEETVHANRMELRPPRTEEATQRLAHELDVHQIELEMQNEELRQARDKVETALEMYTDLYDFAPVGYCTLDSDGAVRVANLTAAGLLVTERARLVGRRFEQFIAEEDRPLFTDFLGDVFTSRCKKSCEVTLTGNGTSPRFVQIEALTCTSGQECRIAVIDITGRKLAEDRLAEKRLELEELNRTLEVRIAGAVDELRQKDQMLILQERLAVVGEMINNIAHQWRQPLNTLGLVVQKLPLFYDSAEFSREFLEKNTVIAMKLIREMSRTIEDFRDFFSSDKEKVTFGVNRVIEHMLSLVETSLRDQKIRIALHSEGDPMISGYPNEYAQVLLNILMNARDALVGNHIDDPLISISAFAAGSTTVVTVTDNAGGIADGIIDRIFDPYFTTKGPNQGTGIGLFMSRTIINTNMGGSLTARNTGNGAEFRIEVTNGDN